MTYIPIYYTFLEKRHKLWARQSTFAGGPTVVRNRHKTAGSSGGSNNRPATATGSYGFGSRVDRFTAIQSTPSSPMVETNPLKWFIRDIDIGDSGKSSSSAGKSVGKSGGGTGNKEIPPKVEMFGYRPIRTRSRHECHFATGSSVPMGKQKKLFLHLNFFSSAKLISRKQIGFFP